MPRKIVSLLAKAGATVDKGAQLLVVEAMRMELTFSAPRKGIVKEFCCAPEHPVSDGAELLVLRQHNDTPVEIQLVELGPGNGLQPEKQLVSAEAKVRLVGMIQDAGLRYIEVMSFDSP